MVRGFERPPDMTLGTRTADMRPAVLRYAENIHKQHAALLADLGFSSVDVLNAAVLANLAHYRRSPYREKILQLTELSTIMRDILAQPKEYEIPIAAEFGQRDVELRGLLGEDFVLGFNEVEKAFTLRDGRRTLDIYPEERVRAMEQLLAKLAEPDVIDFLAKLKADEAEAAKWMLVYRTSAGINDQKSVSLKQFVDVLDADARRNRAPVLMCRDTPDDTWYLSVAQGGVKWSESPVTPGWMFVTRAVVDNTTSLAHADQRQVLKMEAGRLGIARKWRRRTPIEVAYDTAVMFRSSGGRVRLLEDNYDWTEQLTADGVRVEVGCFDAKGMRIWEHYDDEISEKRGACLAR